MNQETLFGLTLIEGLTWVMVAASVVAGAVVAADLLPARPRPMHRSIDDELDRPTYIVHNDPLMPTELPIVYVDQRVRVRPMPGTTVAQDEQIDSLLVARDGAVGLVKDIDAKLLALAEGQRLPTPASQAVLDETPREAAR